MAEERDDEQTKETEGTSGQQPTSQQKQPIGGQQGEKAGDPASQQTMSGGQGFIGSQATDSDESSSETIDRSDFASQGQGAKEGRNENFETGERQESESDIEGSSDKA